MEIMVFILHDLEDLVVNVFKYAVQGCIFIRFSIRKWRKMADTQF